MCACVRVLVRACTRARVRSRASSFEVGLCYVRAVRLIYFAVQLCLKQFALPIALNWLSLGGAKYGTYLQACLEQTRTG